MNEAESTKNGDFFQHDNTENSLQAQDASCAFYAMMPSQDLVIPKLPPAREVENEQLPRSNNSNTNNISDSSVTEKQQDWVALPDSEKQAKVDSEFQQLLELNKELRTANDELYRRVEELTEALTESEAALQWQRKRTSVSESMLNQQTQELSAAQEQIQTLYQQLETAVQTVQRQENLIDNYQSQLEISQQRLAQLERECALLSTNYNDKEQRLSQAESTCRELRTRLTRQQRQTLQFKAALEKCLESPTPSCDVTEQNPLNIASHQLKHLHNIPRSVLTNAQPIRPWSANQDIWDEDAPNPLEEFIGASDDLQDELMVTSPDIVDCQVQEEVIELTTETIEPKPMQLPETEDEWKEQSTNEQTVSTSASSYTKIEDQLDQVIQMFFVAQSVTQSTEPAATVKTTLSQPLEDYWADDSAPQQVPLPKPDLSQPAINPYANDTASPSPSPVVYPQRSVKKRKSLASVELPKFRP